MKNLNGQKEKFNTRVRPFNLTFLFLIYVRLTKSISTFNLIESLIILSRGKGIGIHIYLFLVTS